MRLSSHKSIRIYMGGLILGVNTLYRLFCFFKPFPIIGKGLKCGLRGTSNLGFFWWGKLPTIHQGRFRPCTNLKKPESARGHSPLRTPASKRGDNPPLIPPPPSYLVAVMGEKRPSFGGKPKRTGKAGRGAFHCLQKSMRVKRSKLRQKALRA